MNQKKIGVFIAECRKRNHMTQMELAEKLGVTDRSVSGLGKYMFITDEDCSPSSVVDGSFMSTFTDDVYGWENDHPEPNENKFIVEDKKKATNKAK